MEHLSAELAVRDVFSRVILNCGGQKTIETEVLAGGDIIGRAAAPYHLRESEAAEEAAQWVNCCVAEALTGENIFDQERTDRILKTLLGNEKRSEVFKAAFSVSAAAAAAASSALKMPLYRYAGGICAAQMPAPAVRIFGDFLAVPPVGRPFAEQLASCMAISRKLEKRAHTEGRSLTREEIMQEEGAADRQEFLSSLSDALVITAGKTATLTELFSLIRRAGRQNRTVVFACGEGETADTLICDLAVACGADWIDAGPLRHMESTEKYNRLLRISEKLF